ncbi:hypothetical protein [Pontibacter chinhatensis]|uniref:hypothetical protein n=1 Tax=Pontibacter chinhatensis TaxID=1436961 RepID=UPI0015878DA9|nr:hypothetical protein [Pontibacter chinhatensis]
MGTADFILVSNRGGAEAYLYFGAGQEVAAKYKRRVVAENRRGVTAATATPLIIL